MYSVQVLKLTTTAWTHNFFCLVTFACNLTFTIVLASKYTYLQTYLITFLKFRLLNFWQLWIKTFHPTEQLLSLFGIYSSSPYSNINKKCCYMGSTESEEPNEHRSLWRHVDNIHIPAPTLWWEQYFFTAYSTCLWLNPFLWDLDSVRKHILS